MYLNVLPTIFFMPELFRIRKTVYKIFTEFGIEFLFKVKSTIAFSVVLKLTTGYDV